MTVLSIGDRTNNAELIRDCAELGYIHGNVLDLTYGTGRFWRLHHPPSLTTNDLHTETPVHYRFDFTALPDEWTDQWDTVVFDPPYKLNGTGGSHPSDSGYGVADRTASDDRLSLIFVGLDEAARVLAPSGHLLVKCQDQVVSGHKVWQTIRIHNYVTTHSDLALIDQMHVRSYRPQPPGRRQVHARADYSTMLVFG